MQTYIYIYIIIYIYNICICLCVHLVKQYTPMYKCKLNTYNINTIVDILYGTSFKRLRPPQYSASAPCHFLRAFRLSQLRQRSEALKKAVGMFFFIGIASGNSNIAIEHGHVQLNQPFKKVIFQSYVSLLEGIKEWFQHQPLKQKK